MKTQTVFHPDMSRANNQTGSCSRSLTVHSTQRVSWGLED